ncbi:MAG: mechanosensitive ion channel [Bacteroidetes bacterium]|nr:mechanosensitive ion channel [Bacteroidota bacterium]
MEGFDEIVKMVVKSIIDYLPKLALALIVLIVGLWIIRRLKGIIRASLDRINLTGDITPFLVSIIDVILKILLLFSVAEIVGIETASFIAVMAAGGFAIGLALQGNLGNFAAGVVVLVFKPYKLGDWVELDGKFGKVLEIQIFNTIIETPGMKTLIMPNSKVTGGVVINFSERGVLRLEISINISYKQDFAEVKSLIQSLLTQNDKVLEDPPPEIGIKEFGSHSVEVVIRPYVNPDHYWEVIFEVHQSIKEAFQKHKVEIAYPEGVQFEHWGKSGTSKS